MTGPPHLQHFDGLPHALGEHDMASGCVHEQPKRGQHQEHHGHVHVHDTHVHLILLQGRARRTGAADGSMLADGVEAGVLGHT